MRGENVIVDILPQRALCSQVEVVGSVLKRFKVKLLPPFFVPKKNGQRITIHQDLRHAVRRARSAPGFQGGIVGSPHHKDLPVLRFAPEHQIAVGPTSCLPPWI